MTTEWIYFCNGVTTNKVIGDQIGTALDPDPNATEAFVTPLRPIGSSATEASAWFTAVPLKQTGFAAISEFQGTGPFPILNAAGVDDTLVAQGKACITLEVGTREALESRGLAFITEQGYEILPL